MRHKTCSTCRAPGSESRNLSGGTLPSGSESVYSFLLILACHNGFIIMADVPTSAARTLIDVEKVGMLLLSHLRCRFHVLELFPGHLLARKGKFATPCAVRSAVAPQRPPLRQTLFYTPSPHSGMLFLAMRLILDTTISCYQANWLSNQFTGREADFVLIVKNSRATQILYTLLDNIARNLPEPCKVHQILAGRETRVPHPRPLICASSDLLLGINDRVMEEFPTPCVPFGQHS